MSNLHNVFVYGTLKRNGHNNKYFLQGSEFLGKAVTKAIEFSLHSCGCPMVIRAPEDAPRYGIGGELFRVDDEILSRLDCLENNGNMYQREVMEFVTTAGKTVEAWIYIYIRNGYEKMESWGNPREISYEGVAPNVIASWIPMPSFYRHGRY